MRPVCAWTLASGGRNESTMHRNKRFQKKAGKGTLPAKNASAPICCRQERVLIFGSLIFLRASCTFGYFFIFMIHSCCAAKVIPPVVLHTAQQRQSHLFCQRYVCCSADHALWLPFYCYCRLNDELVLNTPQGEIHLCSFSFIFTAVFSEPSFLFICKYAHALGSTKPFQSGLRVQYSFVRVSLSYAAVCATLANTWGQ